MTRVAEGTQAEFERMVGGSQPVRQTTKEIFDAMREPDATDKPRLVDLPALATDAERAAKYRAEVRALLEPVCDLLNAALRDGIKLTFNIQPDAYGRMAVVACDAVKPL